MAIRVAALAASLALMGSVVFADVPGWEKEALVDFFDAMGGDAWSDVRGWRTSADPCAGGWSHVTCDAAGEHVTGLTFYYAGLDGRVPFSLSNLTHLTTFSCYGELVRGLPSEAFDGLDLEVFVVSYAFDALGGSFPAFLFDMPSLKVIEMYNDELTGTLSAEVSRLTNLERISVSLNSLSGHLPSFASNNKLKVLEMDFNSFEGVLPLVFPSTLETVWLSDLPHVTGPVPASLGGLARCTSMYLSGSGFSGPLPDLAGLTSIITFHASDGNFSGSLPTNLFAQPTVRDIRLGNNYFSGAIPSIALATRLERLSLKSNNLDGPLPSDLSDSASLLFLDVSHNQLSGTVPSFYTHRGGIPESLISMNLGHNRFTAWNVAYSADPMAVLNVSTRLFIFDISHNDIAAEFPINGTDYAWYVMRHMFLGFLLASYNSRLALPFEALAYELAVMSFRGWQEVDLSNTAAFGDITEFTMPSTRRLLLRNCTGIVGALPRQRGLLELADLRGAAIRGALPPYLASDTAGNPQASEGTACSGLEASVETGSSTFVEFLVDPAYDGFARCRCTPGYEGEAFGCSRCAPGYWSEGGAPGQRAFCVACPAGTHQAFGSARESASGCEPCGLGSFQSNSGSTECNPCEKGYFQDQTGTSACMPCPTGRYSSMVGAPSSSECSLCPSEMTTVTSGAHSVTQCIAATGHLVADVAASSQILMSSVISCDVSMNCTDPGSTSSTLKLVPGFWRATLADLEPRKCRNPQYCTGGLGAGLQLTAGSQSPLCVTGHTGPECVVCVEGWGMVDNQCVPCSSNERPALAMPVLAVFVCSLIVAAIAVRLTWLSSKNQETGDVRQIAPGPGDIPRSEHRSTTRGLSAPKAGQLIVDGYAAHSIATRNVAGVGTSGMKDDKAVHDAVAVDTGHSGPVSQRITDDSAKEVGPAAPSELEIDSPAGNVLDKASRKAVKIEARKANGDYSQQAEQAVKLSEFLGSIDLEQMHGTVSVKAKQLVSLFQVMFSMPSVFRQIEFPVSFHALSAGVQALFAANPLSVFEVNGCSVRTDHYSRLVIFTMAPLLVCVWLFVIVNAIDAFRMVRDSSKPLCRRLACACRCLFMGREAKVAVNISLIVIFVVYPGVSAVILETFNCEQFSDGSSYLAADYSVSCSGTARAGWVVYASIAVLVYPVGCLALFLGMLEWKVELVNPGGQNSITGIVSACCHARSRPTHDERKMHALAREARRRLESLNSLALREQNMSEIEHLSFLFRAYEPRYYWWESFEMLRKLLLTSVAIFVGRGTIAQVVFSICVSMLYVMALTRARPYVFTSDDAGATATAWSALIGMLSALLLYIQSKGSSEDIDEWLMEAVLFTLTGVSTAITVYYALIGKIEARHEYASDLSGDAPLCSRKFCEAFLCKRGKASGKSGGGEVVHVAPKADRRGAAALEE